MGSLKLAPEVIKAREKAQRVRDEKPLNEVIRELRKERRDRERLIFKRRS